MKSNFFAPLVAWLMTSFCVEVLGANLPPQLDAVPDQTVTEGSSFTYQLHATDADVPVQPISFGIITGPDGISVSPTGLLNWTPTPTQAGSSYPVTVIAADNQAGRADQSFNIVVRPRNVLSAHWVGAADGIWNNPTNWDIGRIPNDTAADVFDVFWSEHAVTVHLGGDVSVRSFFFESGGTLDL